MFGLIKKVQGGSLANRRRTAVIVALFATMVVAGIWVTTLPSRTSSEPQVAVEDEALSPFAAARQSVRALFNTVSSLRSEEDDTNPQNIE